MNKVAFLITSTGWGGLEQNVLNLAQWLKERMWDITIYTVANTRICDTAGRMDIKTSPICRHRKYFDLINAFAFSKKLKEISVPTLLVFDNRDLDFVFLTKRFFYRNLKVIYQQHMQIGIEKKDFIHTQRFKAIDCWVSPLKTLKLEVIRKTNFNPLKIKVIPLGVDLRNFDDCKYSREEGRKKLGINSRAQFIGILGRIDPKKGQLFLLNAIAELSRQGINIELLIMGEPTIDSLDAQLYYSRILNFVKSNNLLGKVHFRDFQSDIHLFFQSIDIFALPSEKETYGMVTIEAMLSEKPIIASNTGGTKEILRNGKLGLLYENNNLDDFCNKISGLIHNKDKSILLSSKARVAARQKFSHLTECNKWEKLLSAI